MAYFKKTRRLAPAKAQAQAKHKEKVVVKKTPLLPGVISRCHPRYDGTAVGTQTRKGNVSCIPAGMRRRVYTAKALKACGGKAKERCLIKHSTSLAEDEKKKLLKEHFRPPMPSEWSSDPDMWLASTDIEAVMRQYEEAVPSFKFLGVVPIDFSAPDPSHISEKAVARKDSAEYPAQAQQKDPYNRQRVAGSPTASLSPLGGAGAQKCLADEFCHVNLKKERAAGIRTIGAVFNLDPHDKSGSHWIACCLLLDERAIYYFDSYGLPPPPQVSRFMRSFVLQDDGLELKYNGRRFQFGNSECGMYCMYFLICMINRVPFKTFVRHTVPDKYMLELRHVLFS